MNLFEFKRGWQILLLSLLGIAISINAVLLYGFGALVIPFEAAFGWDKGSQQVAITFLYGGAVIGLQAVGWVNLWLGIRTTTILSLLLMALGYLACTVVFNQSIWTLYLMFGILPIIGMGALAITWTQLIGLWFVQHRGLALAIGLSGTGMTAVVMPVLLGWCIEQWGWQAAFVLLAALNIGLIPLAWGWFNLPQQGEMAVTSPAVTDKTENGNDSVPPTHSTELPGINFKQGFRSRNYWACNLAIALVVSAVIGMITNIIPLLHSLGFSSAEAAKIFSVFGASLIIGRLLVGFFLDRYSPTIVAAASLTIPSIGCVLFLVGSDTVPVLMLAVALIGMGAGAEFDVAAYLMARFFGMKDYGRLMGFHQGLITVVSAAAPLMFAMLFAASGDYNSLLTYGVVATLVGGLVLLTLGRPPVFGTRLSAAATDGKSVSVSDSASSA
ncbi:MFS transporter [Halioxenophilus aromaticivorans]|uniref:MFS transporter n=1 Tax=Halioxenophilus aromaticivorans TaxID=1306992 RepID=A0AAV3U6B5_9ALTE